MRRWVDGGHGGTTDLEADETRQAQALGLPPEAIAALQRARCAPPIEAPADAADAIDVLLAVATQWRWGPAGPVGLDYPAVIAVADRLGVRLTRAVLADLQYLEAGALDEYYAALAQREARA